MVSKDFRAQARESLTGKWSKAAIATLIFTIGSGIISYIFSIFAGTDTQSIRYNVFDIISSFIVLPLTFGLIVTIMKLSRNEKIAYSGIFKDGYGETIKVWKICLWIIVKLLLPIILIYVGIFIIAISAFNIDIALYSGTITSSTIAFITLLILGLAILIFAIIWSTMKAYLYKLVYLMLKDNSDMTAKDIVNKSAELMKGNRWRAFCLDMSFVGWILLSLVSLGIALLWIFPYILTSQVKFYEDLVGISSESQSTDEVSE